MYKDVEKDDFVPLRPFCIPFTVSLHTGGEGDKILVKNREKHTLEQTII